MLYFISNILLRRLHSDLRAFLQCASSTVRVQLETLTKCSLTVHPAANGYLVATPGGYRRKGTDHPTLHADGQNKCSLYQALPHVRKYTRAYHLPVSVT